MDLELRDADVGQAEAYLGIFSSHRVCALTDIPPFQNLQDSVGFLEYSEARRLSRQALRYSLVLEGQIVGTICLYSIAWDHRRASIGYALSEPHWNRGIMSRALETLETIAQHELNLNRLQATVLPENRASQKVLEKRGFLREGLLRQYEVWEGRGPVDLELYGKLLGPAR